MNVRLVLACALTAFLTGCMNMPTPVAQISPAHVSSLQYESFDLKRLTAELDSLNRRESQLVVAQEQRIKTSGVQAFWHGYGQGDGIEASELALVRGQILAVTKAMDLNRARATDPKNKK